MRMRYVAAVNRVEWNLKSETKPHLQKMKEPWTLIVQYKAWALFCIVLMGVMGWRGLSFEHGFTNFALQRQIRWTESCSWAFAALKICILNYSLIINRNVFPSIRDSVTQPWAGGASFHHSCDVNVFIPDVVVVPFCFESKALPNPNSQFRWFYFIKKHL